MSSLRTPTGQLPRSVYRRRRLVLLLGLAAVVAVIVLIVVRPGSARSAGNDGPPPAAQKSTVTGAPTDAPSGSATPGASGAPAAACKPANVKLVAVTDAASYGSGAQPQLSMSITNGGSSACSFDVGTGAQEYVITSGSEKIWDSKDCQTGPTQDVETLEPGKTLTTAPFAWDRTRSSTSTCSAARAAVVAGGASYHLSVLLGEAKSSGTKQFLLN